MFYDSLSIKQGVLLDLPMREGIRAVTHDVSKAHLPMTFVNTPTWAELTTGNSVIEMDGINQYLQCLNASCTDLDFIAGDYSVSGWINWTDTGNSEIIIGRYELDVGGWELYLTNVGAVDHLTMRHHHAGTIVDGNPRTGSDSVGWTPGVWHHFGISRSGAVAQHYMDGVALAMTYSTGGMVDPETTVQDLVIGTRFTKNANWYDGQIDGFVIHNRALTAREWAMIYEIEGGLYP